MNKDKIIKDLKKRNNKLENQRRQFELNYYHEQHIVEEKDKEIEKLNNIINEIKTLIEEKYFFDYISSGKKRYSLLDPNEIIEIIEKSDK